MRSLDFTFNRLFIKLFKTKSIDVVKACQSFIGSEVPSCVLKRKTDKFILRFNCVENLNIHLYFTKEMVVGLQHNKQRKHNKQTQSKHDNYQFSKKHDY